MSNQFTYEPLDKNKIIEIYLNSDRNMDQAANVLGSTKKKLWKSLVYHGIKAKSRGAPGKPRPYAGKNQHPSPERIEHEKRVKENNKIKEKYGFIPRFTEEQIQVLFNSPDFTTRKAAKKLNCAYRYVEKLLIAYGLPIPENKKVEKVINPKPSDYDKWLDGSRRMNIKSSPYFHVYIPEHPNAGNNRSMPEHRLIAERKIGRLLKDNEVVNHLNGDKKDNRPENLEVLSRNQHSAAHLNAVKKISVLQEEIKHLKKILDEHNISY